MKFLAICMVMVVAGLSLVPCCAPLAGVFEQNITNSSDCCSNESCGQETKTSNKTDEEKGCNSCSPFFACGSCAGFIFQSAISPYTLLKFPFEVSYYTFNMQLDSEYFDTKWQPPKIS